MSSTRVSRTDYRRVRKEGEEKPKSEGPANQVRIVASRGQRMYISYAIEILNGAEGKEKHDSVILSGMGAAVYNAVNVAEILKRRVKGLHQTTDIGSQTVTDEYEAREGAKADQKHLTVERKVSTISIVLSLKPLDTKHIGYQAPLPESEVTEQDDTKLAEHREPRRGGRGGRGGRGERRGDGERRGGRGGERRDDRDERRGGDRRGERRDDRDDRRGGGRGGDRRGERRDDRAPARGGRGGYSGERRRDDRDDRAPRRDDRDRRDDRAPRRDDRAPRGGRGGDRAPRDDRRDDRAPRRDDRDRRDDRAPRRDDRAPRGGRGGDRDDRAPRGGRGGDRAREERAPRRN